MKDLRACVCVVRVWVHFRLRDSVIYPEMEIKKEMYRLGGLFSRGAVRELGLLCKRQGHVNGFSCHALSLWGGYLPCASGRHATPHCAGRARKKKM